MLKLDDISFVEETFIDSLTPGFKKINNPNDESISVVIALLGSSSFQEYIALLRHESNLPLKFSDQISISEIKKLEECYSDEYKTIQGLIFDFNLWTELERSAFMILALNIFPQLDMDKFPDISYHSNNAEVSEYLKISKDDEFPLTAITFGQAVSKNEFIDWINKNWKEIEKGNTKYLPKAQILKDKFKDIQLVDEIYQMTKNGNNIEKICDQLSIKYPEYLDKLSYDWVNNKMTRYKAKLSKYSKMLVTESA